MAGEGSARRLDAQARLKLYELLQWPARAVPVAAFYLPVKAAQPIAESLAGKDTNVTIAVSVSLAISAALVAGFLAQQKKIREQRKELQRLRQRISELETELAEATG